MNEKLTELTISALEELNKIESRKIKKTDLEKVTTKISNWLLGASVFLTLICAAFVLLYTPRPASNMAKSFVLITADLSTFLAVTALILPMGTSIFLLFRWKKISFNSLKEDIIHEQKLADYLIDFEAATLSDAEFWIERKIKRISNRINRFFGEKTAAVGLIALSYSFSKEFGGFEWISKTVAKGFSIDNIGNTLLLWSGALLVGISLGTILLEQVISRYRFQLEILELVHRRQKRRETSCE